MKHTSSTLLSAFVVLASGCNIQWNDSNVCRRDIRPLFTVEDSLYPSMEDKANLFKLNKNGFIASEYKFQNIKRYDNDDNAYIYFLYEKELIKPQQVYKLSYGNYVYFLYDIKVANNKRYRYCDEETTYKINDCKSSGYNIHIAPSCAIPADQADDYFEKNIKPTLN